MPEITRGIEADTVDAHLNTRLFLQYAARAHADQTVVTELAEGTHRITYADLYDRVHQAANLLQDLGVESGDTIGIYGYSTSQNVELLYAAGAIGATPFILNMELPQEHREFCISHVDTHAPLDVMFVDGDHVSELDSTVPESVDIEYVVTRAGETDRDSGIETLGGYDDLLVDYPPEYDWPTVHEDTAAIMGFTSGTTGKPKAIAHSHRALFLHNIGFMGNANLNPQDTILMAPPLFHWGFQLWGAAPVAGAKLVMPGPGHPDNLVDMAFDEEVTFSVGVPSLFRRMLSAAKDRETGDFEFEDFRVIFAGQSPPRDLMLELETLGAESEQAYSYSEAAGGLNFSMNVQGAPRDSELSLSESDFFNYKSRVAGYPVCGVDVKILDIEDGTELSWDGTSKGDIAIRAPWTIGEYWEMPERSAEARTADGYLRMGDMVTIDERSNIVIKDRIKDAIKSGGEWIPSPSIEELLNDHDQVKRACVIAARHPEWSERPVAIVEPKEGVDPDSVDIDLDEFLAPHVEAGEIQEWWIPDRVVVSDIPFTGTGKYDKTALREEYGDILEP